MQESLEKRGHSRTPVDYEYFAKIEGYNYHGKCHNISPYGVGILSEKQLVQGKQVEMMIFIPKQELNVEVKGEIRHCTGRFIKVDTHGQARGTLKQFKLCLT